MIDCIEKNDWDEAKSIWILKILKMTMNEQGQFSTYTDTFRVFGSVLSMQQPFIAHSKCSFCDFLQKMDGNVGHFSSTPAWLFFYFNYSHGSSKKVKKKLKNSKLTVKFLK